MDVFIKLCNVLEQIFNTKLYIYGYGISFMNIFAYVVVASVSAIFLRRLLDI